MAARLPTSTRLRVPEESSGLLRVAIAGLMWGSIPLALRAADGSSVIKVFYRVLFASLGILFWMTATRGLGELRRLEWRKVGQVAVQGGILTLNWIFFFSALDMTTVATAELLAYTAPVMVAALAPLVTGERFDRRIVLPLALSLGGIAVILSPHGLRVGSSREATGALLALASAITYAVLMLRSKKLLRGISGMSLMLIEYATASALLLPFVAWLYSRGQGPTGVASYAALAVLGLFHTAFAGVFFLSGLGRVRTDRAAVLTYAEPVSAVLIAALFLSEPLTIATVAGGVMVVVGGIAVSRLEPVGARVPAPLEAAGTEGDDESYTR